MLAAMAIFTPEELDEQLLAWKAALQAISRGQSYRMGENRQLTRADLPEVRSTLEWLEDQKAATLGQGTGPRVFVGRPRR